MHYRLHYDFTGINGLNNNAGYRMNNEVRHNILRKLIAFILCPIGIYLLSYEFLGFIYYDLFDVVLTRTSIPIFEVIDLILSISFTVLVGFLCAKIATKNPYTPVLLGASIYMAAYFLVILASDGTLVYKILTVGKILPSVFIGIYISEKSNSQLVNNDDKSSYDEICSSGVVYTPVPRKTRLLTFSIDMAAMGGVMVILLITLDLVGLGFISNFVVETPLILSSLIFSLIYYIPFEALTGRTPGKLITGTKVITIDGKKCGAYHAVGRAFLRNVPFDALSIFRKSSLCWHDSLVKTVVIKCR